MSANTTPKWIKLEGEKGIWFREAADGSKAYMLRTSHGGQRESAALAGKSLAEVREIRAILEANAERGTPPFTYRELALAQKANVQEAHVRARMEQKRILADEKKRQNSTIRQIWENVYWPERTANVTYSKKDTLGIDGRWRHFIKPFFGEIPVQELQKRHFAEFLKQMREIDQLPKYPGAKPKHGKGAPPAKYSETTIRKCLKDIRRLWTVAQEHDLVSGAFPGKATIKDVRENEHKICYLEADEAKLLLHTVYERRTVDRIHHDVFCYVTLSLFLGLRAGDIHKLTWQNVAGHMIEDTKNGRGRFVDFDLEPVKIALQERLALYPVKSPADLLFPTDTGRIREDVPRRYFKIIAELGFNDVLKRRGNERQRIDFHALRHTYATQQITRGGVDQIKLKELLGHRRLEMTLRYVEIADSIKAEESKKILKVYNLPEPAMAIR